MSLPSVEVSQTPEDKFREYLVTRSPPQRFTDQQRDLVRFIFSKHRHFDTDELIDALKDEGLRVSRATVYRTLSKLVDAGLLQKFDVNGRLVYDHDYGYPQHEHLVCESCNKMIEFQDPSIEQVVREIAARHQFQMSGHTLLVRGVCNECVRKRMTKRRLDLI